MEKHYYVPSDEYDAPGYQPPTDEEIEAARESFRAFREWADTPEGQAALAERDARIKELLADGVAVREILGYPAEELSPDMLP